MFMHGSDMEEGETDLPLVGSQVELEAGSWKLETTLKITHCDRKREGQDAFEAQGYRMTRLRCL